MPIEQIITESYCVFRNDILLTFPPCNFHLREAYLQMFRQSLETEAINSESVGIIHILMDLLNDTIYTKSEPVAKKESKLNQERLNNFYTWEMEKNERTKVIELEISVKSTISSNLFNQFSDFDRDVKFDRIFKVLDLLLLILEADLALWIIKFSYKTFSNMNREDRCPLVASVLWKHFDSVLLLTPTIKTIISIFVDMVSMNYPKDKINIISVSRTGIFLEFQSHSSFN